MGENCRDVAGLGDEDSRGCSERLLFCRVCYFSSNLISSLSFRPGDLIASWRTPFCVARESSFSVCLQLNLPSSCRKPPPPPKFIISLEGITASLVLISQRPGSYTLFPPPQSSHKGTRLWILPLECTVSLSPVLLHWCAVCWSQIIFACVSVQFSFWRPMWPDLIWFSYTTAHNPLMQSPQCPSGIGSRTPSRYACSQRHRSLAVCLRCLRIPPAMGETCREPACLVGGQAVLSVACFSVCVCSFRSPLLWFLCQVLKLHFCNCLWFCLPQAWNILSQSYGLQWRLSLNATTQGSFLKPLSLCCALPVWPNNLYSSIKFIMY